PPPGSARAASGRARVPFPLPGDLLGEFVLLADLGRGTSSGVFLARQPSLGDRPVVLKLTRQGGAEPRSMARLLHTHVVPLLFALDVPDRRVQALVMPYLG